MEVDLQSAALPLGEGAGSNGITDTIDPFAARL